MADYCADDFVLGNWIEAKGHKVVLSTYAIDHMVLYAGFVDSIKHQVRWMKSTRFLASQGPLRHMHDLRRAVRPDGLGSEPLALGRRTAAGVERARRQHPRPQPAGLR